MLGLVGEQLRELRLGRDQAVPLGRDQRRGRLRVPAAAGSSNSRSSTACTSVPRAIAWLGASGSRSTTRNR